MAIDDATGSIQHNVHDAFEDVRTAADTVEGTIGTTQTGFGGGAGFYGTLSFGADFAGMASDKLPDFDAAVDTYRNAIQDIINGLQNKRTIIEEAVKGEVANKVEDFFNSVKDLLNAYVRAIDTEKKLVHEANDNWIAAAAKISGNISSDADSIRSSAGTITVE